MRRTTLLVFISILLLTGCGRLQSSDERFEQISPEGKLESKEAATPILTTMPDNSEENNSSTSISTAEIAADGSLKFDLSAAASILIKSAPDSKGILITDEIKLKDITNLFSTFHPYSKKDNYKPEYNYTLTFYSADGAELTSLAAYENFMIAYQGVTYYDSTEHFYISKIRQKYITEIKKTYSCSTTSFLINEKEIDIAKEIDPSINAIMKDTWFGSEDFLEPNILFECHINPQVDYMAVFDVEKMDFVFGAYGAPYTYETFSANTLVYAFQDSVFNYWGDIIYQNKDDDYYIYSLENSKGSNNVIITLSSKQEEKLLQVTCINYHKPYSTFTDLLTYKDYTPTPLSELHADLTHDGVDELISISKIDAGGDYAYLQITDKDGNILWSEEANVSHAGWNSVFLCNWKGNDYLLVFNPYMCTGLADYMYVLFNLTGPNTMQIVDSGTYSFRDSAKAGTEGAFNEDTFRPFADKVYNYLKDSFVLISTQNGELIYSTEDKHLSVADQYKPKKWISETKSLVISQ